MVVAAFCTCTILLVGICLGDGMWYACIVTCVPPSNPRGGTSYPPPPRWLVTLPRNAQVHVIEVSDLKGKDASGTSDPIVYATCLGSTKHTRVRKGVNSAVFDEVLYFNPRGLSR